MTASARIAAAVKFVRFYARFTPSFTAVGYFARGLPLRPIRAHLTGATWLVTGAAGGLGRAIAVAAARAGAHVYAVARRPDALSELVRAARGLRGEITPVQCDLSRMADVRALVLPDAPWEKTGIDVLVNNVGVLAVSHALTEEDFETSYATNLLGHYVLTEGLFASGAFRAGGAIVNMTSGGLYNAPLNTQNLDMPAQRFSGPGAYAAHKRAQLALADIWRTAHAETGVRTYAVHPGWADTGGVRTSMPRFRRTLKTILRTPEQGADTALWLGAHRPVEAEDQVWFDRRPRSPHAYPHTRAPLVSHGELIARLETDCERVLGPDWRPAPAAVREGQAAGTASE